MTENSFVDNTENAVPEARKQLEQSQLQLHTTHPAEAALQSQVESLTAELGHMRSRLQDFNHTHNELMSHSKDELETIVSLRSQFPSKSSNSEPILRLLRQLLLTLTTVPDVDLTPDDTLYHFLCCAPNAEIATLLGRANLLLKFLHLENSPMPDDPLVQVAGRLVF